MSTDKEHIIDASGQILGRLAARVAILLRGKDRPDFAPHKLSNTKVIVYNTSKIEVSGSKYENKEYISHSGYLGGIKFKKFKDLFRENPNEIFKKAVYRMLPKNKLRDRLIKKLELYAEDYKETQKAG